MWHSVDSVCDTSFLLAPGNLHHPIEIIICYGPYKWKFGRVYVSHTPHVVQQEQTNNKDSRNDQNLNGGILLTSNEYMMHE